MRVEDREGASALAGKIFKRAADGIVLAIGAYKVCAFARKRENCNIECVCSIMAEDNVFGGGRREEIA